MLFCPGYHYSRDLFIYVFTNLTSAYLVSNMSQALYLYLAGDTVVYGADGSSALRKHTLMLQEIDSKPIKYTCRANVINQDIMS